jgi:hypothetical protein
MQHGILTGKASWHTMGQKQQGMPVLTVLSWGESHLFRKTTKTVGKREKRLKQKKKYK